MNVRYALAAAVVLLAGCRQSPTSAKFEAEAVSSFNVGVESEFPAGGDGMGAASYAGDGAAAGDPTMTADSLDRSGMFGSGS